MDSGKSLRVSAGMRWESSPCWCIGLNTCRPQNYSQPTLSCNLELDVEFQLRCRGGRSDIKFQGLEILPTRTFPHPYPTPISSEAEILTLQGKFSKLSSYLLHT